MERVLRRHPGTVPDQNWGERGIFYNPGRRLPKGIYLLTFKERDGANDRASQVDRPGIYRLNLGIGREAYRALFGAPPARPAAGGVVSTGHDFRALDVLMPHPVYAWMAWIGVLNPSEATFARLVPLIDEACRAAERKWRQRVPGED